MREVPVIYENAEILVVNKPAGLAVQGGEGVRNPLDRLLAERLGAKVYPVHRLDKETSGLLVVAKSAAAAGIWTRLIASGRVRKEYRALCFGLARGLDSASAVGKTGRLEQPVMVAGERKSAETFYRVARIFPVDGNPSLAEALSPQAAPGSSPAAASSTSPSGLFSLLELTLGTGRTHQIRIHLAQSGSPILADDRHGNFKVNKLVRKALGIKTLQLAATRLTLPLDGRPATFEVPLPPHMEEALERMA